MRCLDLFSGIGGFALGLESVGMHTVGFCEIEPFPRAVLAHHWPGVPIHDDVRTLSAESVPWLRAEAARGIDLICGGFPCQDISVAGKGAGLSGARSGLWSECSRLVGELRPRWALFENVGALKQRGIDRVCADLEGHGYTVWPLLVGAGVGVGAPHRRERIWIVGRLADTQHLDRRANESGRGPEGRAAARRSGASVADRHSRGRQGKRYSYRDAKSPIHSESFWNLADGRGERPVGEPTGSGLEGQRADAGGAEVTQPWHPSPRWPARPGEPQWEWEEPRLVEYANRGGSEAGEESRNARDSRALGDGEQYRESAGRRTAGEVAGSLEQQVGSAVDGLSERLVRAAERRARRANREALKAYGNSVVPAVVALIGKAILEADEALR